jgi:ribonuclease III family protein
MQHPKIMSANVLAYLGDSVMNLWVREYLIKQGYTKTKQLQQLSTKYLSGQAQAKVIGVMVEENFLTEEETAVYLRGRNFKSNSKAKNLDIVSYKHASGYEALWGYWYLLENHQRLCELWEKNRTIVEDKNDNLYIR